MRADFKISNQFYTIEVAKDANRWSFESKCSCGKKNCFHILAASDTLNKRLLALQHMYIVSDLDVDKYKFLEPRLPSLVHDLNADSFSQKMMEELREIIQTIDSVHSDDYYWNFHKYVLDLAPGYDYDSHYLEDRFPALLIALFENPGYKKAVLDKGTYADPSDYEIAQ